MFTLLTELPEAIFDWLLDIEEDVLPTDTCVEQLDSLFTLAQAGANIALDVLNTFGTTCIGG